jgi:hypothetical protein
MYPYYNQHSNHSSIYEEQFINQMKNQERIAITAIVQAKKLTIQAKGSSLEETLKTQAESMKHFSSVTFVSNIKEGFEGEAAKKAETFLTQDMKEPKLKSPIR